MAVNRKIITGLSNPDGSPPAAAVLRTPTSINTELKVVQDIVPKITDLSAQKDARIRAIKNNKDLTQVAVGAQIKSISDVFDAQIQEFLTMSEAYCAAAAQQEQFYTREACLQRAVAYGGATITESIFTRLGRENVLQLMNEAALAASNKDQVLVGCIMIEVSARATSAGSRSGVLTRGQVNDINELLATIPTDSEKVLPMLLEFNILRREAAVRAGKGGPTAKIAVALLKQGSV